MEIITCLWGFLYSWCRKKNPSSLVDFAAILKINPNKHALLPQTLTTHWRMICTNALRLAEINGTLDVKGHLLYGAGSTAQAPNLLTHSGMTKNKFNLPATCSKGQLVFLPADLKSSLLTQSRAFSGKGRMAMPSKQNTHKKWREVHDLTETLTVVARGVQKCSLKKSPPGSWSESKLAYYMFCFLVMNCLYCSS